LGKIDRLTAGNDTENDTDEDAFLRHAELVSAHFAAVFHRMMTGRNAVAFFSMEKVFLHGIRFLPTKQLPNDYPSKSSLIKVI